MTDFYILMVLYKRSLRVRVGVRVQQSQGACC